MNKRLIAKIENFVSDKRKSADGGWSPVEKGDIQAMSDVVYAIVCAKWEPDIDRDTPIDFRLIDRTKYQRDFWSSVPYHHKIETAEQYTEYERAVMRNLKIALSEAEHLSETRFQPVDPDKSRDVVLIADHCNARGFSRGISSDAVQHYFYLVSQGIDTQLAFKQAVEKANENGKK